jgi:CubicO group peptidase (beta-lactamase class C family)
MGHDVSARSVEDIARALVSACESSGRLVPETGIAVSVVHDGDVAYQGAFGLRDRARRLPVTPRTVFEIGSLTKSMTVAALVQAQERGELDLDEPLAAKGPLQLGGPHASEVTLTDVLSHRTGLPAHDCLWYFGGYSTRELAARIARLQPVPQAFRRAFIYNNALYGCSSLIVEDVLHRSWESLVREQILVPLGMNATILGPTAASGDEALPYLGGDPIDRKDASSIAAAGGGRSNIEDLTRWALFQLGRGAPLLSEGSMRTMHAPRISSDGMNPLLLAGLEWLGTSAYGHGWFLGEARGHRVVHHMGFIDGFSSVMALVPDLALGIVVVANDNLSAFPGLLAEHLFARIAGHEPSAPCPSPAPAAAAHDAPSSIAPSSGFEGAYEDAAYGRIDVVRRADELSLVYRGHEWPLRFHAPEQAVFVVRAFGLTISIPVAFGADRVSIPLSLDPRVAPQVFTR